MSTFTTRVETTPSAAPDPTKHVNYNVGMVLGIDDFNQEFAYLSGRDQWMARDLIGYGTVSGLHVLTENDVKGPRVVVEPGVAVSPRGQLIRVPTAQCAYLNDWLKLDSTKSKIPSRLESPPAPLRAYVVLCYRECPTDKVPIPGEPCRSEDDVMAPSRLVDDFRLELMLDPPGQREEDAIRRFVAWLRQIEVSDAFASTPLDDILDAIRGAAHLLTSPPDAGSDPLLDFMTGSPPSSFVMNSADVCEYLDAVFRLWVTELRPKCRPDFLAGAHGCSSTAGSSIGEIEECLLLAEVDVPVIVPGGGADWQVEDPSTIAIDEQRRPIVVHLRMLQEVLLCGRSEQLPGSPPLGGGGGGPVVLAGDVTGPAASTSVARIRGVVVDPAAPSPDQVLTFSGGRWRPAPLPPSAPPAAGFGPVVSEQDFALPSNDGAAVTFSRSDHRHGTPPDRMPAHLADTSSHSAHSIAGDVVGTLGNATVSRIQNRPVNASPPLEGQVLRFRTNAANPALSAWRAEDLPAASTGSDNLTRIVGLSWAHALTSNDLVPVTRIPRPPAPPSDKTLGIVVAFGTAVSNLRPVKFGSGALDEFSFQVFLLQAANEISTYVKLNVNGPSTAGTAFELELIPVKIASINAAGRIASAAEAAPGEHNGAAIVCNRTFINRVLLGPNATERKIFVEIRGDLIPDTTQPRGVALDGNFLGAELPTGDRIPGGTFWSWFTLGRPGTGGSVLTGGGIFVNPALITPVVGPVIDAPGTVVRKRSAPEGQAPAKKKKTAKKKAATKKAAKKPA